jgi:hypothetical protein
VDRLGERLAVEFGLKLKVMPAEWDKYGPVAGFKRNMEMATYVSPYGALVAVWDGKSGGTYDMITKAEVFKLNVYVKEVRV